MAGYYEQSIFAVEDRALSAGDITEGVFNPEYISVIAGCGQVS
jgi:hypothetical protein